MHFKIGDIVVYTSPLAHKSWAGVICELEDEKWGADVRIIWFHSGVKSNWVANEHVTKAE